MQTFEGQGIWAATLSANSFANLIGEGESRHLEMFQNWHGRTGTIAYVSNTASGASDSWKVSADVKIDAPATGWTGYTNRAFVVDSAASNHAFRLVFKKSTDGDNKTLVEWKAGTVTGTWHTQTTVFESFVNVSLEYDGATGLARGMFGNEVIFEQTLATGLAGMNRIQFYSSAPVNTPDYAKYRIDNVASVPEPMTLSLLAAGALGGVLRRRQVSRK
ncbi:MAG: PEP-CTERM sorting domain-containing protein [Planctomycetes bacterium]|nr:PEP-CTERM sorting domain-containing protein [Planctomycetota bacterium]